MLIISGGQSGADLGGLVAAELCGCQTGGFMPKGFRTENGPRPERARHFEMLEHSSSSYVPRTVDNIRISNATIVFGKESSSGSRMTIRECIKQKKPCLAVPWPRPPTTREGVSLVIDFLIEHDPQILNIAGNRESVNPGIKNYVIKTLCEVLGDGEDYE